MGSGLEIFAREDGGDGVHVVGGAVVAMGLLADGIAFLKGFIGDFFAEFDDGIKDGFGAGRATGNIDIDGDQFIYASNSGCGVTAEHSSCDSASAHGNDIFGFGHFFVEANEGGCHFHGDSASGDDEVSLARTGAGNKTKSVKVEARSDEGCKFDEAAGGSVEEGPEAGESCPVMEIVYCG